MLQISTAANVSIGKKSYFLIIQQFEDLRKVHERNFIKADTSILICRRKIDEDKK